MALPKKPEDLQWGIVRDYEATTSSNKTGRVIIETDEAPYCKPSDLELRIRREVMDALNNMITNAETMPYNTVEEFALHIKDRLNLLWGDYDD